MNKNILLTVVVILAVAVGMLGALLFFQKDIEIPPLAGSGSSQTQVWSFLSGLRSASFNSIEGVLDSTAVTSTTYTAKQICDYSVINRPVTDLTATSTLPTAATLQTVGMCLEDVGSYKDVLFRNTGTATTTIVFTAGASTTIDYASSTNVSAIPGGGSMLLRFYSLTKTAGTNMVEIQAFTPFAD